MLHAGGYHVRWWRLNSADYGVPQTRKRLVLVAALDFVPRKPAATHCDPSKTAGQLPLLSPLPGWIGWYEAIKDLLPTLPETQFADWQLARLPECQAFVVDGRNGRNYEGQNLTIRDTSQPIYTVHTGGPGRHRVLMPTGRVVQMTPRALARFQAFPDSYQLPEASSLACRGIGNAMPPLLYQRVMEAQRC